jgi:hypothetical protein
MTDNTPYTKIVSENLKWLGIDFDETLANNTGYPDFTLGEPIEGAKEAMEELTAKGFKISIYTARAWSEYNIIEEWLERHNITYKRIICGKPLFRYVIDDRNIEFKGNWREVIDKVK